MSAMLPAINTKGNTCTVNTPFYELLETGELKRKTTSMGYLVQHFQLEKRFKIRALCFSVRTLTSPSKEN
jgi:hypothetical protein